MQYDTYLPIWPLLFPCLWVRLLAALDVGLGARDGHRLLPRHVGTRAHPTHPTNAYANRESRLLKRKKASKVLLKGEGHATFYYEKEGPGKCGSINGVEQYVEMKRAAMCEPWRNPQKLKDRNTNMIVALPLKIMRGNLKEYCGKEIIARYKGKTVRGLVAWDGCVKCDENGGLDFSSTVFGQIVGEQNCHAGRLDGLTWELTNNQLWDLNGDAVEVPSSSRTSSGARSTLSKGGSKIRPFGQMRAQDKSSRHSASSSKGTENPDKSRATLTKDKAKGLAASRETASKGGRQIKKEKEKEKKEKKKEKDKQDRKEEIEKKKKKKDRESKERQKESSKAGTKMDEKAQKGPSVAGPTAIPKEEVIPESFDADWENMHRDAPAYNDFEKDE